MRYSDCLLLFKISFCVLLFLHYMLFDHIIVWVSHPSPCICCYIAIGMKLYRTWREKDRMADILHDRTLHECKLEANNMKSE